MKRLFIFILLAMPTALMAQSKWTIPAQTMQDETTTAKTNAKKVKDDTAYLAGAVPVKDGKVVYEFDIDAPGKSAAQVYAKMLNVLDAMAKGEEQFPQKSKIAAVNEDEHSMIALFTEWLVFQKKILMLDRTEFNYRMQVDCLDGKAHIAIMHLTYNYDVQGNKQFFKAEDIITDEVMISKDGKKLKKQNSKFRKKTVDRMNEIRNMLTLTFE